MLEWGLSLLADKTFVLDKSDLVAGKLGQTFWWGACCCYSEGAHLFLCEGFFLPPIVWLPDANVRVKFWMVWRSATLCFKNIELFLCLFCGDVYMSRCTLYLGLPKEEPTRPNKREPSSTHQLLHVAGWCNCQTIPNMVCKVLPPHSKWREQLCKQ